MLKPSKCPNNRMKREEIERESEGGRSSPPSPSRSMEHIHIYRYEILWRSWGSGQHIMEKWGAHHGKVGIVTHFICDLSSGSSVQLRRSSRFSLVSRELRSATQQLRLAQVCSTQVGSTQVGLGLLSSGRFSSDLLLNTMTQPNQGGAIQVHLVDLVQIGYIRYHLTLQDTIFMTQTRRHKITRQ